MKAWEEAEDGWQPFWGKESQRRVHGAVAALSWAEGSVMAHKRSHMLCDSVSIITLQEIHCTQTMIILKVKTCFAQKQCVCNF